MRILMLGGTLFLGRHLVEAALARGHAITVFNRGKTNPELFPGIERLYGDRDGDLQALAGRTWDAVIDTSGYVPRVVRTSAKRLAGAADHYTFISSISVYADFSRAGNDEESPVGTLPDPSVEEVNGETYGPLKALCERAVEETFSGGTLIIRPGLIVGPHDPTDRFTYWPRRIARGGEVLAPGRPDRPIQWIDVRDLAEWIIRMIESGQTGRFNATGPDRTLTMGRFLEECRTTLGSDASFRWIDDTDLAVHGVEPWTELPLWIPETGPWVEKHRPMQGMLQVDIRRALAAGLTFRPLADTIRDTLDWDRSRPEEEERKAGLDPGKERRLLRVSAFDL